MEVGSVSIELGLERSKFDRGINQVSNTKLAPIDVGLRLDSKAFNRQLTELKPIASVGLKADTRALQNQLKSLNTQINLSANIDTRSARLTIKELLGTRVDVRLYADTSALQKQLSSGLTSKISFNAESLGLTDGITKAIEKGFEKAKPKTNILGSLFSGLGSVITSPLKGALQGAFLGIGTPIGEQLGKGISKAVQQSLGSTIGSVELLGEKGFLKSLAGLQQIPGILESVFDGTPIAVFVKTAQKQFEILEKTLDQFNVTLRPKAIVSKVVTKQEVAVESSAKSFESQQSQFSTKKKAGAAARSDFLSLSGQRANVEEIDKQITARQQELQKYLKLISELGSKIEQGKASSEDRNIFAQASTELEATTKGLQELQQTKDQYFAKLKDQIEILAELGVGGDLSKEALDLTKLQETFQTLKSSQLALQESRKGLKINANTPEAIRDKKLERLKSNVELRQASLNTQLSSSDASPESVQKAKKQLEGAKKALELFQIEIANPAKEIESADKKIKIANAAFAETLQKLESAVADGLIGAFEAATQQIVKVGNFQDIPQPQPSKGQLAIESKALQEQKEKAKKVEIEKLKQQKTASVQALPKLYVDAVQSVSKLVTGSALPLEKIPNIVPSSEVAGRGDYNAKTNTYRIKPELYDQINTGDIQQVTDEALGNIVHEIFHAFQHSFGKAVAYETGQLAADIKATPEELSKIADKVEASVSLQPEERKGISRQLETGANVFQDRNTGKVREELRRKQVQEQVLSLGGIAGAKISTTDVSKVYKSAKAYIDEARNLGIDVAKDKEYLVSALKKVQTTADTVGKKTTNLEILSTSEIEDVVNEYKKLLTDLASIETFVENSKSKLSQPKTISNSTTKSDYGIWDEPTSPESVKNILKQVPSKVDKPTPMVDSSLELNSSKDVRSFVKNNLNSKGVKDLARRLGIDTKNANKDYLINEIGSLSGIQQTRQEIAKLFAQFGSDKLLSSSGLRTGSKSATDANKAIQQLKEARHKLADALKEAQSLDEQNKQILLAEITKKTEEQQAIARSLSSDYQLPPKQAKSLAGVRSQLKEIGSQSKGQLLDIQSQNPASTGTELGSNLVDAIGVGMKAEAKIPIKTIKSVMQQIQVAAETQAEIKSPSRVFKRIGKYLTEGLAIGIEQSQKLAQEAMFSLMAKLSSGTGEVSFDTISETLKGTVDNLNRQADGLEIKVKIAEDIQADDERKASESTINPEKRDNERENIRRRAKLSSDLERKHGMEGLAPEILPDRIQDNGAKLEDNQSIFQSIKGLFKSLDNSLIGRLKKRASRLALEVDTAIAPSLETSAIQAGQRGDIDAQKQYKKLAKQGRAAASGIARILESPEITDRQAKQLQRLTEQLERVYDTIGRPLPSQGFIESLGLQATSVFKNLSGLIKGFLAFTIGSWAQNFFSGIAQESFKAFVEVDRLKTALNFSSGSKAAGARNLEFVNKTSDDLGIPLKQSQEGFSSLNAAARRTVLEGQGVKDLFLGMAQASTVLSLSNEQNQRGFKALTDILSKGKASAEEMRQQLAESGLTGAMGIAARATGTTEEEFNRLLESGQIISQDFLPKFAKQLQAEFGDAAQDASGNAQSAIYKFENAYLSLQQSIGEGVAPAAMIGLNTFATLLKSIAAIGKELAIIIGAVSVALLFNLGKALYATISNIILTKAATGTLGGALGSLASTLANSTSVKIAAGFFVIFEAINLINQAINTKLIQSFDDSARAAKRAAEESAKYFNKAKPKDNKPTSSAPESSNGFGRFSDKYLQPFLEWSPGNILNKLIGKKMPTYGELEQAGIKSRVKVISSSADSYLKDARVRMGELQNRTGKVGQLPGIDTELQQTEQARQVLQAENKRNYTNKGLAIPADRRQQLENQNLRIQDLNNRRTEIAKPVTRDLAEADRQISAIKADIENLKTPEAVAALGGTEAAEKEKEALQSRLNNWKKYKAEIEATIASLKIDPVLAFTAAIRQLNLAFAENQEKNQLQFDARKAVILKQQSAGFSANKFNSRETGLKLAFEEQKRAYADLQNAQASANQFDAELAQPAFQSTLQRLGVSPDASAAKIDDLLKNTSDESDKNILEKLKAGREQKNKLSEARSTVEESNFKVKQSTQDLTLAQFQDSQANQQSALQRAEAKKLNAVKSSQQARLISESEAAEKLARIQLGSTQQQQKNIASQLAALKLYHAQGGISAEEFNTRQRELTNQQTDLEKQATDQRLAVFEAGNRRRLEQIELANRKAEAVINLSQTNRATAVKEKVLDGAISSEQAAREQNQVEQKATADRIGYIKTQIAQTKQLRKEGVIDAKTATEKELQLNQELAQANQQAIDQQIQAQEQLRDAIDKTFQRRKAQLDLEKLGADIDFESSILGQARNKTNRLGSTSPRDIRATELSDRALELNNKGATLSNERTSIEKQAALIGEQIKGLDKLNLSTEQYNDRRTQLENEYGQLALRYLKNQQEQEQTKQDKILNNKETEINAIERARAAEENRHKRLVSQLDEQKSKLDLINQSLELTSKLNQSRFDLSKALSDATVAPLETRKSNADKALELSRRLDDKDLDPRVKGEVKNQLNTLGFGSTELEILNQRAQIEDEIAAKKLEALKIEQAFQRKSLELDLQRQAIAAQMAIYDAEGAQLAAQKSKIEAESALRTAKVKGDDLAIKSAEISIELAEKEATLADKKLEAATNGFNAQSELAKNAILAQEVTQRTAINQQLAADGARKQAQSMERIDTIAKNSARNKPESSATNNSATNTGTTPSDWENPYAQKKGEGLFEYHSRLNQARMQGKLVETNTRTSVVEDNILTKDGIVPRGGSSSGNSSKLQVPKTNDEVLKSALGGTEQRLDSLISLFSDLKNYIPTLALDNLNLAPLEKNLFNPLALPTEPKMQDWRSTSLINLGNGASLPPIDRTAEIANSAQIQPGAVQQQTVDAVSFAFTQKFDTLSAAIMQVAGMPRSLTVQSPQPVDDAASIWNDFAAAKVGAAGL